MYLLIPFCGIEWNHSEGPYGKKYGKLDRFYIMRYAPTHTKRFSFIHLPF